MNAQLQTRNMQLQCNRSHEIARVNKNIKFIVFKRIDTHLILCLFQADYIFYQRRCCYIVFKANSENSLYLLATRSEDVCTNLLEYVYMQILRIEAAALSLCICLTIRIQFALYVRRVVRVVGTRLSIKTGEGLFLAASEKMLCGFYRLFCIYATELRELRSSASAVRTIFFLFTIRCIYIVKYEARMVMPIPYSCTEHT